MATKGGLKTSKNVASVPLIDRLVVIPYFIITIALLLVGAKMYIYQAEFNNAVPASTYQAVFLTNGQIYFGHLKPLNRSFMQLNDVYYLQEDVLEVPSETEDGMTEQKPQLSVIRLGEELHQPQNGMMLNKEHILFWENLKQDSQIIEAISQL